MGRGWKQHHKMIPGSPDIGGVINIDQQVIPVANMSQSLLTAHVINVEPASLEIVPSSGAQSQAPTEVASSEVKPVGDQSHASSQVMPTGSEAPPNIDDAPSQPDNAKSNKALRKRKRPTTKNGCKSNKKPNKSKKSETSASNVSGGDVSLSQILGPSLEEMMASDTRPFKHHNARRCSGGLGILIKNHIIKGVKILKFTKDVIAWIKLDKNFFS